MASVNETIAAVNAALEGSSEYRCQTVSWDDVERGTVGGSLSSLGANITDTRLWAKDGKMLYTVRAQNWNEKLGAVSADEIALMAGGVREGSPPTPITLADFLKNIGTHGEYAGMERATDLSKKELDGKVSVRFQTTFLPVPDESLGAIEFAPEMYNYQTRSDEDPKNLLLLCTTQGSAVQQDGAGAKKLFHHAVDPNERSNEVCRYWFEAERTKHRVGGAQVESAEEKADALSRGKAVSAVIGTKAMGTRFNVLMTIQVPLEQKPRPKRGNGLYGSSFAAAAGGSGCAFACFDLDGEFEAPVYGSLGCAEGSLDSESDDDEWLMECADDDECEPECASGCAPAFMADAPPELAMIPRKRGAAPKPPTRGTANAARVSRGSLHDKWQGLTQKAPKRDAHQHVTVTFVIYNTVSGGVPSVDDVKAAIDDMESLYSACGWKGHLADGGADFMKSELTVHDAAKIAAKVVTQPYMPVSEAPIGGDAFPISGGAVV